MISSEILQDRFILTGIKNCQAVSQLLIDQICYTMSFVNELHENVILLQLVRLDLAVQVKNYNSVAITSSE